MKQPFILELHLKPLKMLFWILGPTCHGLKFKGSAPTQAALESRPLTIQQRVPLPAQSPMISRALLTVLERPEANIILTNSASTSKTQELVSKTIY